MINIVNGYIQNLDTDYLGRVFERQMAGKEHSCPRCGAEMSAEEGHTSTEAPVLVCEKCSHEEIYSLFSDEVKPLRQWWCFTKNKIDKK